MNGRRPSVPAALALLALLALLAGCRVGVHSRATEASANEVLAALLEAGIDADKLAVDEKSFDVEVDEADLTRALALLRAQGLPREPAENLGQLFKKEGLVSTPAEERVRYLYGVSQELEKTLGRVDGVVQARVHIVIPASDPLGGARKVSSASVFIKHRPVLDPGAIGPLVRTLVTRAVEGLDADRISVAFVAAEPQAAAQSVRMVHWLGMKVEARALWALNLFCGAALLAPLLAAALAARRRRRAAVPHA